MMVKSRAWTKIDCLDKSYFQVNVPYYKKLFSYLPDNVSLTKVISDTKPASGYEKSGEIICTEKLKNALAAAEEIKLNDPNAQVKASKVSPNMVKMVYHNTEPDCNEKTKVTMTERIKGFYSKTYKDLFRFRFEALLSRPSGAPSQK